MRHIKYLFLVLSVLLLANCNQENFLEVKNQNNLDAGNFWATTDDLNRGLVATYAALQLEGLFGGTSATQLPVRSDVGRPNNWNANARSLQTLAFNENTSVVKERWQACYVGVYRANQVLANLENIDNISKEELTLVEAQTRFLRGFFYYSLYRGYNKGSVILLTDVPGSREELYQKLAPAEEVYNVILSDLEFAYNNLPKEYADEADLGRVTWGAAASMLGKLHINEKDFETAKRYFKEVIDSDLYDLVDNIEDNFSEENEFNEESIFEVSFSIEAKPGTAGSARDGATGSEATSRARILAVTSGGGWRVIMPSYWVTMLFRSDTADLSLPMNADRVRPDGSAGYSVRASASVAIANDIHSTLYQKESNQAPYNNREASYMKKFQNWRKDIESNLTVSGINERAIRLADIMLLYAETLIETGGSYTEALDMVNQIRARAGVKLLDAAGYNSESLMEHIMWVERPLELMFEGHDLRWEDLVRWDKAKEQYQRLAAMRFVQIDKTLHFYDPANPDHENLQQLQEFQEAADLYDPELHNYFPIPSTELTSNPDLLGG